MSELTACGKCRHFEQFYRTGNPQMDAARPILSNLCKHPKLLVAIGAFGKQFDHITGSLTPIPPSPSHPSASSINHDGHCLFFEAKEEPLTATITRSIEHWPAPTR